MADPVTEAAICGLAMLAEERVAAQHYLGAIQAFRALLTYPLPAQQEAKVRIALAKVLLEHTYDDSLAKKELNSAQLLLAKLPGHAPLQFEVLDQLAKYHGMLGERKKQRDICHEGIQLWNQGLSASDRDGTKAWVAKLYQSLSEAHSRSREGEGEQQLALEALDLGEAFAREHGLPNDQVLFQLQRVQLALQGQVEGWEARAGEQLAALEACLGARQQEGTAFVIQAWLQVKLLKMLVSGKRGSIGRDLPLAASSSQEPPFITELHPRIAALRQQPPPYQWMPIRAQAALADLIAAAALRPRANQTLVRMYLERGAQELGAELEALEVIQEGRWREGGEASLANVDLATVRLLLSLLVALHLEGAKLELMVTNLVGAQQPLLSCLQLLHSFPTILQYLRPHAHLVLAQYAHSLGAGEGAVAGHCERARQLNLEWGEGQFVRVMADCQQAIAILASPTPDSASRAIHALGALHAQPPPPGTGMVEAAAQQYASALTHLAGGDPREAHYRLKKALKVAHMSLGSNQMVSVVLNAMAPLQLQMKSDRAGARNMVDSASSLSDSCKDQMAKLGALEASLLLAHQDAPRNQEAEQRLLKEVAAGEQLLQRQREAASLNVALHQYLLGWGLKQ